MENTDTLSQLAERLTVILGLVIFLALLITDRFIWTKARGLEWKQRAQEAEQRTREAEAELRENTSAIKALAEKAEEGNRMQAEILKLILEEKQR